MWNRKAKSIFAILALCACVSAGAQSAQEPPDLTDITSGDPFFYTSDQNVDHQDGAVEFMGPGRPDTTHSQIPHLPFYVGYMNTNFTYRFVNIVEQVFTMIGEGKHGLWRVHENGSVREYLKPGAEGLAEGADIFAPENQEIINTQYTHFLPGEPSLYRLPWDKVDDAGRLTYVDLPITHPKYKGKYKDHEPVELANWFCTMSEADYPYAKKAMDFAFNQEAANKVGPLGKRAGLDIKENYTNVLRLEQFSDARSWVNIGQKGKDKSHVKWEAIDTQKTNAEYYFVERPFFNSAYLFLIAVFDNQDNRDFQYVRPDGAYYESLKAQGADVKTTVTQQPRFHISNEQIGKAIGTPLYGVHHPNRAAFGGGGACPLRGGDWADYPKVTGGSGWPTQYEEITPLCDAVLIDIKLWTNLDNRTWNDPYKNLANAGVGTEEVTYKIEPGHYGKFTDPYNVKNNPKNPDEQDLPNEIKLTFPAVEPPVSYNPPIAESNAAALQMIPQASNACRPLFKDAMANSLPQ